MYTRDSLMFQPEDSPLPLWQQLPSFRSIQRKYWQFQPSSSDSPAYSLDSNETLHLLQIPPLKKAVSMNFTQYLTIILQALLVRSTQFAFTVGAKHFAATITDVGTPGNSGSFMDILQIALKIMAGQAGTFQFGVITVTIQELVPVA